MTGTLGSVLAAAAFFVASHLALSSGTLRPELVSRLGERGFRVLYSAIALASLAWLILAYRDAPFVGLWPAFVWTLYAPAVVMPFAAILLVCGLTTRNPTAVGWDPPPTGAPAPGILKITRHPVLWAVVLWAAAHMIANGDAASLILFGALGGLSFAGMAMIDRKRRDALGAAWGPIALTTSVLPFAAIASGRTRLEFREIGMWRILAGIALYLALMVFHGPIIGYSALPL